MGFFGKIGKAIDRAIRDLTRVQSSGGEYTGRILIGYNIPRFRQWYGPTIRRTLPFEHLPEYYNGKKVKLWVALSDDEDTTYGPIFYKRKRAHNKRNRF